MKSKENTALTVQKSGYTIFANADYMAAVNEELSGQEITFDRIKIPSGGATMYEMPTEDGDETESVKDFSGVILHHHPLNAYYKSKYTGGSHPPDCGSYNGFDGIGNPGGDCKRCPYNQYGTGENGKSKACKNRARLYILREGEIFPLLLSLPTGSLKGFNRYRKVQMTKGHLKLNTLVTKFSLKKAVNEGGIPFSQAVFEAGRALTPEESAVIAELSRQIKEYSENLGYEDYIAEDDTIIVDPGCMASRRVYEYADGSTAYSCADQPESGEIIEPASERNHE